MSCEKWGYITLSIKSPLLANIKVANQPCDDLDNEVFVCLSFVKEIFSCIWCLFVDGSPNSRSYFNFLQKRSKFIHQSARMWRTDYPQIQCVFIHSDFYLPVSVSIHDENRSTAIPKDLNVLYWKYISHWISVSIKLKSKHIRCQEKYTIVSCSRLSYEK